MQSGIVHECLYTAPTIMDLNLLACMLTHTSSIPFDGSQSVISMFSFFFRSKHTTGKEYWHHGQQVAQMQTYRLQMKFHHHQQPSYFSVLW